MEPLEDNDSFSEYIDGLTEQVLGAPRQFTSREIAEAAGVPMFRARRFWRALGFANVPDDEPEFTRTDGDALIVLLGLISDGLLDETQVLQLTRLFGRTSARMARSYSETLLEPLTRSVGRQLGEAGDVAQAAARSLSDLEALLIYSWRRQVAAALHRLRPGSERTTTTVGFADLVEFTRLSRELSDGELTALVSRFEERSGNVITTHGGRLIKSLGDEVLFVADAPRAAADIALHFVENVSRRNVPGIRVGLEYGPVITHGGDIYGDTVNLASRLTQVAQPNHILVGPQLAAALAALPEFDVESVGMTEVRGFGLIEPAALKRPGTRETMGTPTQI